MKLTILGTGNAAVTECYNTCFVLSEKDDYFLVDGGGGNGILHQLKHAGIDWKQVRTIFVTHKHLGSHHGHRLDDPHGLSEHQPRPVRRGCRDLCPPRK